MPVNPGTTAVLLNDDAIGVATESNPRQVQRNGRDNTFRVSLNRDWLEQLNLATQGEPTLHSMSAGLKPVLVQKPAIIVQPATAIMDAEGDQ